MTGLGRECLGPGREPLSPWGLCLCVCTCVRKYLVGRQWVSRPICVAALFIRASLFSRLCKMVVDRLRKMARAVQSFLSVSTSSVSDGDR